MKRILNYLFPNDWYNERTIELNSYSHLNGTHEGISKIIYIQRSPSTGRYRKQVITINMI